MSITDYYDDPEHWEGTHTSVLTKPIVDTTPLDEFAAAITAPEGDVDELDEEDLYKIPSLIDLAVTRLKARRAQLKTQMRNLRSYPESDSEYEDGTVIIWHDYENQWGPDRHFCAIKEDGRWYLTGEFHGHRWDEFVTHRLLGYDFSEVEVVRPPEEK